MLPIHHRHLRVLMALFGVMATFKFLFGIGVSVPVWDYGYDGQRSAATTGAEQTGGRPTDVDLKYSIQPVDIDSWDPVNYVVGPVTGSFRDNLRNDSTYITSWMDGGFTNGFMAYVNMAYLGFISNRIPVFPPFTPVAQIDRETGVIPFSTVFDLPRLRRTIRLPVLEWSDIKDLSSPPSPLSSAPDPEPIGCWSAWATGDLRQSTPRRPPLDPLIANLSLDISYTAVPRHTRRLLDKDGEWDPHLLFWSLAALVFPNPPNLNPSAGQNRPLAEFASDSGHRLPPDEHLACFDFLYYMSAARVDYEWAFPWSPAWRFVGRHLRFEKQLLEIGITYIRKALRVQESELPPFIAVHVRHGDFGSECEEGNEVWHCIKPLSVYASHVSEVQKELEGRGINVLNHHVLLTSDETNVTFWSEVTARGWRYTNHTAERTVEIHGGWYPTLVDVVSQSLASGFVGTADSTVSLVSKRRVEDWNGGVTRMVQLGH